MKTLYFDCYAGASGDMILGALVGAGVDPQALIEQLQMLVVGGWQIEFEKVDRSGISSTYAKVETAHEHAHRHLGDILKIIYESHLNDRVKDRAARIFSRLGEAEAYVHNLPVEKIHFHEVGALDAIIDVCGAAICFDLLGIENFICSPLRVGHGMARMAHGTFPIPPPAVAELLKGRPIYAGDIEGEFVTPTGAAIITTVCDRFEALPSMKIHATGYGAGTRNPKGFPNALRVLIGETADSTVALDEPLLMIETNIDDMSPQLFGHVMDRALQMGALDCYLTQTQMKKNRPGILLSILCETEDREKFLEMLFSETTTIGARSYEVKRRALARESVRVETAFGPIDVKVAYSNGSVKAMPEFEQCRVAATKSGVALREVQEAASTAYRNKTAGAGKP
ncbi:MAG: nickel pincer cofactor biosynthesis protein LarC [Acidobacteria bacterium]|nr:MAG: nickel pincer cofactor biosynthesis protein LarC [Acidobacteriota bacterium]